MKYATLNLLRGWVYSIIHCASQALQSTPSTILHHLHHAKVAVMTPVVNAVSSGVPEEDEEGTEDSPTSRSSTHKVSLLHCRKKVLADIRETCSVHQDDVCKCFVPPTILCFRSRQERCQAKMPTFTQWLLLTSTWTMRTRRRIKCRWTGGQGQSVALAHDIPWNSFLPTCPIEFLFYSF